MSLRMVKITVVYFFFLLILPPPMSTLFPYTTLFRSGRVYPSLHLISPKFNTQVPDFPMPDHYPVYPNHRSEEHTSELQSHSDLVCRLLLEKKKNLRRWVTTRRRSTRY